MHYVRNVSKIVFCMTFLISIILTQGKNSSYWPKYIFCTSWENFIMSSNKFSLTLSLHFM